MSDSDPSLGTVHEAILLKHPEPATASSDYCLLTTLLPITMIPTLFSLTSLMASILDVSSWKKIYLSFARESEDLCDSLACLDVTGCHQLCAGQKSSCEAIVHCVRELYDSEDVEGVLCVNATNAFNSLNRELALCSILHLCPSFGRLMTNTYRFDCSLFIDGDCIFSREGTTLGDPLAMSMFAVATVPLIQQLDEVSHTT